MDNTPLLAFADDLGRRTLSTLYLDGRLCV